MENTKVIKGKCLKKGKRFALEVKENGSAWETVNFIEIDDATASSFASEVTLSSLETASSLIPCTKCGGRRVFGCGCAICRADGKYNFQCVYCNQAKLDYPEPVEVWVVMDISKSMDGSPLENAKSAAVNMVKGFDSELISVGIVTFGTRAETVCEPITDKDAVCSMIKGLECRGGTQQPFTHMYKRLKGQVGKKCMVILTDGSWTNAEVAIDKSRMLKEENPEMEIFTIGFGGANINFIRSIATSYDLATMTTEAGLTKAFGNVGQKIKESSLNIKIPKKPN